MSLRERSNVRTGRSRLLQQGYAATSAMASCLRRGARDGVDQMWSVATDLLHYGFCFNDVANLCGLASGLVAKIARGEGIKAVKTGKMVTLLAHWVTDPFARQWGAVYLEAIERLRLDQDGQVPNGLTIRDAILVTEFRAGSWDAFTPALRSRHLIKLTDMLMAGEVRLKRCSECGFSHMVFRDPIKAGNCKDASRGHDCPLCPVLTAPSLRAPTVRSAVMPAVDADFDDLFS